MDNHNPSHTVAVTYDADPDGMQVIYTDPKRVPIPYGRADAWCHFASIPQALRAAFVRDGIALS